MLSLVLCLESCLFVDQMILDFEDNINYIWLNLDVVGDQNWEIESTVSWLKVFPERGNQSETIRVECNRSGLTPGTYQGELHISSNRAGTLRVRVAMEVSEGWNGAIEGYVYDDATGEEIQGALVWLSYLGETILNATTDATGYYELNLIAANAGYLIYASKEGYDQYSSSLQPIGGTTIQHDIFMQPETAIETTTSSSTTTSSTLPTSTSSSTTSIDDLPETTTTISEGSTSTSSILEF
jgi:hypothetical protein